MIHDCRSKIALACGGDSRSNEPLAFALALGRRRFIEVFISSFREGADTLLEEFGKAVTLVSIEVRLYGRFANAFFRREVALDLSSIFLFLLLLY